MGREISSPKEKIFPTINCIIYLYIYCTIDCRKIDKENSIKRKEYNKKIV